jgi:hypothetical protein
LSNSVVATVAIVKAADPLGTTDNVLTIASSAGVAVDAMFVF